MPALIPYLVVRDARAAIGFYAEAFGARTVGDSYLDGDRIGHAGPRRPGPPSSARPATSPTAGA